MTLKIFYILDLALAPLPESKKDDTPKVVAKRKKMEKDELFYRGHILNALSDRLYDLYTNTHSAREIYVTDLVSSLSSRATLRQLTPQVLLSKPPARLACYAQLLPMPWKRIELKRTLGRKKLFIEERTLYNAKRSSQLGSQVGGLQMRPPPPYIHINGSV